MKPINTNQHINPLEGDNAGKKDTETNNYTNEKLNRETGQMAKGNEENMSP